MPGAILKQVVDISPAAVGSDETITICTLPKGSNVLWVHASRVTLANGTGSCTLTIGDAGDADGFVTSIDLEAGAADDHLGTPGAYMTTAGGKNYNADTAVTATYDQTNQTGTVPVVRVWIGYMPWQG